MIRFFHDVLTEPVREFLMLPGSEPLPERLGTITDAAPTQPPRSFITVWTDPDFDAAERAFYYVRVLEISTPALDGLWRQLLRDRRFGRSGDGAPGARLHLADLVHALKSARSSQY